tara:strand:- start:1564 stop:2292 length:729 start_codon:yes stop_codon:yes gene_type:complete
MQRLPDQPEHNDPIDDHEVVEKIYGPSQSDIDRSWEGYEEGGSTQRAGGIIWKVVIGLVSLVVLVSMTIGLIGPLFGDSGSSQPTQPHRTTAYVIRVIDGRTIVVDHGEGEQVVRMIGVDTPPYGNPYYDFAQQVTASWLNGREVLIEADQEDTDIQGRLLRYVYLENVMVNAALILNGLGTVYPDSSNLRYNGYLADMELQAKESEVGIWDPAFRTDDVDGTDDDPQTGTVSPDEVRTTAS